MSGGRDDETRIKYIDKFSDYINHYHESIIQMKKLRRKNAFWITYLCFSLFISPLPWVLIICNALGDSSWQLIAAAVYAANTIVKYHLYKYIDGSIIPDFVPECDDIKEYRYRIRECRSCLKALLSGEPISESTIISVLYKVGY